MLDEEATNREKGLYEAGIWLYFFISPSFHLSATTAEETKVDVMTTASSRETGEYGQGIIFMNVERTPSTLPSDLGEFSLRQPEMWLGGRFCSFLCLG